MDKILGKGSETYKKVSASRALSGHTPLDSVIVLIILIVLAVRKGEGAGKRRRAIRVFV
jgi:hypothetical protein